MSRKALAVAKLYRAAASLSKFRLLRSWACQYLEAGAFEFVARQYAHEARLQYLTARFAAR